MIRGLLNWQCDDTKLCSFDALVRVSAYELDHVAERVTGLKPAPARDFRQAVLGVAPAFTTSVATPLQHRREVVDVISDVLSRDPINAVLHANVQTARPDREPCRVRPPAVARRSLEAAARFDTPVVRQAARTALGRL